MQLHNTVYAPNSCGWQGNVLCLCKLDIILHSSQKCPYTYMYVCAYIYTCICVGLCTDEQSNVCTFVCVVQELNVTWAQMEFDHEKHHRTNIMLISASEEVIETLEDNQVGVVYIIKGAYGFAMNQYVCTKCASKLVRTSIRPCVRGLLKPFPCRCNYRIWWPPNLLATSWRRLAVGKRNCRQLIRSSPYGLRYSGHGPTLRASSLDQKIFEHSCQSTQSSLTPLMLISKWVMCIYYLLELLLEYSCAYVCTQKSYAYCTQQGICKLQRKAVSRNRYICTCVCTSFCMYIRTFVCISQALMQDAEKTPNVVKACNKPGLYETLEDIQKRYFSSLVWARPLEL